MESSDRRRGGGIANRSIRQVSLFRLSHRGSCGRGPGKSAPVDTFLRRLRLCDSGSIKHRHALRARKRQPVFRASRWCAAGKITLAEVSWQCQEYRQHQRPGAIIRRVWHFEYSRENLRNQTFIPSYWRVLGDTDSVRGRAPDGFGQTQRFVDLP